MATTEYMRFTTLEVREGRATAWQFVAGWFVTGGFRWAWFRRKVADEG